MVTTGDSVPSEEKRHLTNNFKISKINVRNYSLTYIDWIVKINGVFIPHINQRIGFDVSTRTP